jgi:hypothetical protein
MNIKNKIGKLFLIKYNKNMNNEEILIVKWNQNLEARSKIVNKLY